MPHTSKKKPVKTNFSSARYWGIRILCAIAIFCAIQFAWNTTFHPTNANSCIQNYHDTHSEWSLPGHELDAEAACGTVDDIFLSVLDIAGVIGSGLLGILLLSPEIYRYMKQRTNI